MTRYTLHNTAGGLPAFLGDYEVTGTAEDFRAAIDAAKAERETASGTHKTALTRLIQRLENAR